jgi:hypothetical protein
MQLIGVGRVIVDRLCDKGGALHENSMTFGEIRRIERAAVLRVAAERTRYISMLEITREYGLQRSQLLARSLPWRRDGELGTVHARTGAHDALLIRKTEWERHCNTLPKTCPNPTCPRPTEPLPRGHVCHERCAPGAFWLGAQLEWQKATRSRVGKLLSEDKKQWWRSPALRESELWGTLSNPQRFKWSGTHGGLKPPRAGARRRGNQPVPEEKVAEVTRLYDEAQARGRTLSARALAPRVGLGKSTVATILAAHKLSAKRV